MIIIDYNDKRPIYEQVMTRLQSMIINGVLEPDEKLPSVRALAIELSINPNTIQRAYSELEREGLIYSVKGRGNFVKADSNLHEKKKAQIITALQDAITNCKQQGIAKQEILDTIEQIYQEVTL